MRKTTVAVFIGLVVVSSIWITGSAAQISIIPGSSARGALLLQDKSCLSCHSFNGTGGTRAPDLAQKNDELRTPMALASALWNHAPRMWRAMDSQPVPKPRPVLDSADTADLFAYFYSLSYSKASGNSANGARVFEEKRCSGCHEPTPAINGRGVLKTQRSDQSPISTWSQVDDPMAWAEQMWNHSRKVNTNLSGSGLEWPRFTAADMGDLLTYLRTLPETRSASAVFQPGDPEQGRIVFERSCESCHSLGQPAPMRKIALTKHRGPDVMTAYVAAMWNHAPLMQARAGSGFPVFGRGDMANLVAYLFTRQYFDEEGNADRGAMVYKAKNCVVCHENRRTDTGAPDLKLVTERFSAITISSAIWKHGPSMLKVAQKQQLSWPEMSASEMSDLLAFLNGRLVSRIARPN